MFRPIVGKLLVAVALAGAHPAAARPVRSPVVVELYTAQGCDSCPDANRVVGGLAGRKGVLPLTFSVDYWDYLGWKDTFADAAFTERQRSFVKRLKAGDLYTPEVVVDGAAEAPGVDPARVEAMIRRAAGDREAGAPRIRFNRRGTRAYVGAGSARRSTDVWLVRYDPKPRTVRVRGDDRKTRPVTAFNVVRELVRLGSWRGRARSYVLPPPREPGLASAVLVQARDGGPVLAASGG